MVTKRWEKQHRKLFLTYILLTIHIFLNRNHCLAEKLPNSSHTIKKCIVQWTPKFQHEWPDMSSKLASTSKTCSARLASGIKYKYFELRDSASLQRRSMLKCCQHKFHTCCLLSYTACYSSTGLPPLNLLSLQFISTELKQK